MGHKEEYEPKVKEMKQFLAQYNNNDINKNDLQLAILISIDKHLKAIEDKL